MQEFQSSPGLRAGCYVRAGVMQGDAFGVSILTRPSGRVLPFQPFPYKSSSTVSILTRPSGRVLHQYCPRSSVIAARFQSSPGLRAGCYGPPAAANPRSGRFQSSPGLRAGCYRPKPGATNKYRSFNPHPAFGPGATRCVSAALTAMIRFNPHPAFGPGATASWSAGSMLPGCFNPHPAFGPGATAGGLVYRAWSRPPFQSSPGLRAGCYHAGAAVAAADCPGFNPHPAFGPGATGPLSPPCPQYAVSILTRPSGRVLPPLRNAAGPPHTGFNPHPAFGPGATRRKYPLTA